MCHFKNILIARTISLLIDGIERENPISHPYAKIVDSVAIILLESLAKDIETVNCYLY